jgi:hypothetical protein
MKIKTEFNLTITDITDTSKPKKIYEKWQINNYPKTKIACLKSIKKDINSYLNEHIKELEKKESPPA